MGWYSHANILSSIVLLQYRDALIIATGKVLTAFFAGFIIFGIIEFLAFELGNTVAKWKFPIKCASMLHGFAGYFDYWTLDVSRCSCLPSENGCSSFCTSWIMVQVKVIYFSCYIILLFTYDCILTYFREKTVIKISGDEDNKVSWSSPDFTDK